MKRRSRAQSLVELALIAPVLLVLLLITVDVGRVFSEWVVLTNAAREGAYTAASTVNDPSLATPNAIAIATAVAREGASVGVQPGEVAVSYPTDSANGTADIAQVTVSHRFAPISPFVGSVLNLSTPVMANAAFRVPLQTPTPIPVAPTATFAYINDNDPGITYGCSTAPCAWNPGRPASSDDLNRDAHASVASGAYMTYTFTGTGISLITEVGLDEGRVDVYLDGASMGTIDLYRASPVKNLGGQVVYSVTNLTLGPHTLKLVHNSSCTGGATDCFLVVDALQVTLPNYVVTTSASPASFARGRTVTVTVTVTGSAASNIQVAVEGIAPGGANQTLTLAPSPVIVGQSTTFTASSVIPAGAPTGTYTVKVTVSQASGGAVLYSNNAAATFVVT